MTFLVELYTTDKELLSVGALSELQSLLDRYFTPDSYVFSHIDLAALPELALEKNIIANPTVIIHVDGRELRYAGIGPVLDMALHSIQMRMENDKLKRNIKR